METFYDALASSERLDEHSSLDCSNPVRAKFDDGQDITFCDAIDQSLSVIATRGEQPWSS